MKQILLNGETSKIITIKDGDEPHLLVMSNVAVESTISVELTREGERKENTITEVPIVFLHEVQNKIETFRTNNRKHFEIENTGTEKEPIKVIKTAVLDLGIDGEVALDEHDILDIELDNLNIDIVSTVTVAGGRRLADELYTLKSSKFLKDKKEKEVDLSQRFLILQKNNLPDGVELMYDNQKVLMSKDYLLQTQEDRFGLIGYDESKPIIGSYTAIVLDLEGVSSVYLNASDERDNDIPYFTIED